MKNSIVKYVLCLCLGGLFHVAPQAASAATPDSTAAESPASATAESDPLWPRPPAKWSENAENSSVYKQVENAYNQSPGQFTTFMSLQLKALPQEEVLQTFAVFLWNQSFGKAMSNTLNINNFLLLSDTYRLLAERAQTREAQIQFFRNALISLHAFEMLAMTDGLRCADPKGGVLFRKQIVLPRVGVIQQAYTTLQPQEYITLLENLPELDEKLLTRPENTEVCLFGLPPEAPKAAFLGSYEWHPLRKKAHVLLQKSWITRYEAYTGVTIVLPEHLKGLKPEDKKKKRR